MTRRPANIERARAAVAVFAPWLIAIGELHLAMPQQSSGAFETGALVSNRGPHGLVFHKLGGALDASVPPQRQGRFESPSHAGAAVPNETAPEAPVDQAVEAGRACGRLLHRDVDEPAGGRTDPSALGHRLSSRACLEDTDRLGLELQKPERRAVQRNPRKIRHWQQHHWPRIKKPAGCGLIWFSLTREGFCLFRRCSELGRRWVSPLYCGTVTGGNACRSLEG